jgi:hypothetical protein
MSKERVLRGKKHEREREGGEAGNNAKGELKKESNIRHICHHSSVDLFYSFGILFHGPEVSHRSG